MRTTCDGPRVALVYDMRADSAAKGDTMAKLLTVQTSKIDISDIVAQVMAGESIADDLDNAIEFGGILGGLVERIDGPLVEGIGALLEEAIQTAMAAATEVAADASAD
jgi:hypothetical protein